MKPEQKAWTPGCRRQAGCGLSVQPSFCGPVGAPSPAGSRGRLAWAADNPPGVVVGRRRPVTHGGSHAMAGGLSDPRVQGHRAAFRNAAGDQGPGQPRTLRDWPPSTGDRASGRVSSSLGGGRPPWGRLAGCAVCPADADGTQGPDLDEARGPPRPRPAQASGRPWARMRGGCQADLKLLLPTIR